MTEYIKLLILAFFKQKNTYSITELAKVFGLSVEEILGVIDSLVKEEYLTYKNDLLHLTASGRLMLQNHSEDFYCFDQKAIDIPKVDINKAWCIDQIYIPEGFQRKV